MPPRARILLTVPVPCVPELAPQPGGSQSFSHCVVLWEGGCLLRGAFAVLSLVWAGTRWSWLHTFFVMVALLPLALSHGFLMTFLGLSSIKQLKIIFHDHIGLKGIRMQRLGILVSMRKETKSLWALQPPVAPDEGQMQK